MLVHAGSKSQKSFRRLAGQDLEIALRFVPQKKRSLGVGLIFRRIPFGTRTWQPGWYPLKSLFPFFCRARVFCEFEEEILMATFFYKILCRNANVAPWAVSIKIAVRIFVSRSSWYRPSCEIENLVVGRCTHDPGWYPLVCSMSEHTRKPCIAGHPLHFERNLPRETIFKKCENLVSKKS